MSTGRDPVTGKRRQRTLTGRTKGEVEREVRKIGVAVDKGTYVKPWDGTVNEMCDSWLRTATRGKEQNTVVCYGWRCAYPGSARSATAGRCPSPATKLRNWSTSP